MSHNNDEDDTVDCGDDEDDTVILEDDEGNETEYEFLTIVVVDGMDYALLTPYDTPANAEATEIFIFLYEEGPDGEEIFSDVDEDTFKKVKAEAERLAAEEDDGDDGDDPN